MQMEKELNHVPRREIDRSVEVLHFFGGKDSSRRVLCLSLAPPAPWSTGVHTAQRKHPSGRRSSDGRAVLDVLQCLMSRM